MNRPDALNALSRALRAELGQNIFADLAEDETVRVAVLNRRRARVHRRAWTLKEAGETGFALGADGGEIDLAKGPRKPILGRSSGRLMALQLQAVSNSRLMCDVLLASENAKFADTHARVGIMPGWGLESETVSPHWD